MTAELVERVLDRCTARIRLELDGAHLPLAAGKLDFHLRVGAPLSMAGVPDPAHSCARLRKVVLQDFPPAALDTRRVHRNRSVYVSVNRVIIENRCGESIPPAERLGDLLSKAGHDGHQVSIERAASKANGASHAELSADGFRRPASGWSTPERATAR